MKKMRKLFKKYVLMMILSLLTLPIILAPPPSPHNIRGIVYKQDSSLINKQVFVSINVTNSSYFQITQTNGIGPPIVASTYIATVSGSDWDSVIAIAWNSTSYGVNNSILSPTTTYLNIIMNTTRPSETNVTILTPENSSIHNVSSYFNLTARIHIIGGTNGLDCSAKIFLNDTDVLNLAPLQSATNYLGNIPLNTYVNTSWNISANFTGSSNITVIANCSTDGLNFQHLNIHSVSNISIQDKQAPIINLVYPINNSILTASSEQVTFQYNVTDGSPIANCSLIINNKINYTNHSITKGTAQEFKVYISNDTYGWYVNCTENSTEKNIGTSDIFNLSLISNLPPKVTNLRINSPINLIPGTYMTISCNATISDQNNVSDIRDINSTFHSKEVSVFAGDDNNNHYTNNTCQNISRSTNKINISCTHKIYYYAESANWSCNITASDSISQKGSNNITTKVNELLAIDISPSLADYGLLNAGENSIQDITLNITNFGNIDFNITVQGYGDALGDNYSMVCDRDNISVGYEKYSGLQNTPYDQMTNLSSYPIKVQNISLPHRTDDTTYKSDRNYTYWKMGIPLGMYGNCLGYMTFTSIVY